MSNVSSKIFDDHKISAAAERGSLGIYGSIASFSHNSLYIRRFYLQSIARVLTPGESVSTCMRCRAFGALDVRVLYSALYSRASYMHLQTCKSVWLCPVCAVKIATERGYELSEALEREKYNLLFVTFTLKHNKTDRLDHLLHGLNQSYRAIKSGRFWKDIKEEFGIYGGVTGLEITYGKNGWHPHKHALFFIHNKIDDKKLARLNEKLNNKFVRVLNNQGFDALPGVAVKTDRAGSGADWYLSKWGITKELTLSESKNGAGYTPFQLLDLFSQGKRWAGQKYQEYAKSLKGKNQLVYTRGLKKLLGIKHRPDKELVERIDLGSAVIAILTPDQWNIVLITKNRENLLNIACKGDALMVHEFLKTIGIDIFENLRIER